MTQVASGYLKHLLHQCIPAAFRIDQVDTPSLRLVLFSLLSYVARITMNRKAFFFVRHLLHTCWMLGIVANINRRLEEHQQSRNFVHWSLCGLRGKHSITTPSDSKIQQQTC
eukprot:TRINITY_DN46142_c0_g2_i3.p1 TRINITY_DN46142_c0_g2~~TRINITY_DN46142_c0_g2_i3.p1  ORF type:complete len:112 (-),score=6.29 TRINITY_DN46142_c0_g2_i3:10-345(-)